MNSQKLDSIFDLVIADSTDSDVIKTDDIYEIFDLRDKLLRIYENLEQSLEQIEIMIKKENRMKKIPILRDELNKIYMKLYHLDIMNSYTENKKLKGYLNPFLIIDDFQYKKYIELLTKSYSYYVGTTESTDKYIFFYAYNLFKKAAYEMGLRTYDVRTLTNLFLMNGQYNNLDDFEQGVFSDEEFADNFKNNSGIQLESIPYHVSATVVYRTDHKESQICEIKKGKAYYSQSKYDELTEENSRQFKR